MENIIKALEEKNLPVFSFLIENHQGNSEDIFMFFNDKDGEEYREFFMIFLKKCNYDILELMKNTKFNNDKFSLYFPDIINQKTAEIFFERNMFKSYKRYGLSKTDIYVFDYDKDKVEFLLNNDQFVKEEYFLKYVTEDLCKEDLETKGEIIEKIRKFLLENEEQDPENKLKRKICDSFFPKNANLLNKILEDRPLYNSDMIYYYRKDSKCSWRIDKENMVKNICIKKSDFEDSVETYKNLDEMFNTDKIFKIMFLEEVIKKDNDVILNYILTNNLIDQRYVLDKLFNMNKIELLEKMNFKISEDDLKQIINKEKDPKIDFVLNQYKKNIKFFHGYKFSIEHFNQHINKMEIHGSYHFFQKIETCSEEQMKPLLTALSISLGTNHLISHGLKIFVQNGYVYYGCFNQTCNIKNIGLITKNDPIIEIM